MKNHQHSAKTGPRVMHPKDCVVLRLTREARPARPLW